MRSLARQILEDVLSGEFQYQDNETLPAEQPICSICKKPIREPNSAQVVEGEKVHPLCLSRGVAEIDPNSDPNLLAQGN